MASSSSGRRKMVLAFGLSQPKKEVRFEDKKRFALHKRWPNEQQPLSASKFGSFFGCFSDIGDC
jgi:hypothetical protein